MRTFSSTEKNYNRQLAAAYIVYMMAGSYFDHSGTAKSFRNLYLHYAEMPRPKQYQYEERVIQSMDRLGSDFLQKISNLRCEVFCALIHNDFIMEFRTGGFEGLRCTIQKDGMFRVEPVAASA